MNRLSILGILICLLFSCGKEKTTENQKADLLDKGVAFAEVQLKKAQEEAPADKLPRSIRPDGSITSTGPYGWTSGFFPGNLWYLYELTKNEEWVKPAIERTELLDSIQYWTGNHDVGFMIYCSYGNGYKFGGKTDYKQVIINAAESLSARFNPQTGCIKSWEGGKSWDGIQWKFPVIVDNMMNLELLFEASLLSGNSKYYDIAVTHANTTIKNHYRDDFSSWHVIDYDPETGEVRGKYTHQGFNDDSSWARGQAWGLYGYTLMYRYTKDPVYLKQAENIALYILNDKNLPKDLIPYWDYQAATDEEPAKWAEKNPLHLDYIPRDASAAAITASALIELGELAKNDSFIEKGRLMIENLTKDYLADTTTNRYFVLDHSVGSIPHNGEVDVPLVYADYYYLEGIYRLKKLAAQK